MAFLRVNGWAIPLIDGSPAEEHVVGGDFGRSFTGKPISDERYDKRVWSGRTPPVTELVALAIQGAVRGLGHVWPFDSDFYSSKGLGPGSTVGSRRLAVAADGASVVNESSVAESAYGNASLALEPAVTNILAADQRDAEGVVAGSYTAIDGATLTIDTVHKLEQSKALKVVTSAAVNGTRGGFETVAATASAATAYIGTFYAYASTPIAIRCRLVDSTGAGGASKTVTLASGKWMRIATNAYTTAGGAVSIRLEVLEDVADGGLTFWCDAFQIEAGSVATTWADASRAGGDLSYSPNFLSGYADATVNLWARLASSNPSENKALVSMPSADFTHLLQLRRDSGANNLVFATNGGGGTDLITHTNPWNGSWHMITAVLRRNAETSEVKKTLYVDGAQVGTSSPGAASLPTFAQLASLFVGHSSGSFRLSDNGLLDDVMVLPYAAPSDLIAAWYAMGKAMSPLSLVYVDGDAMPDAELSVLAEGKAHSSGYVAAHKSSAFRANLRAVDVELWEV